MKGETSESPAVARRHLRLALRREREAKELTQAEVAAALDWSLSKVNRIEAGDVTISTTDLQALLKLFEVTNPARIDELVARARAARQRGWWDQPRYREHLTSATMQMLQYETEATAIRVFQPTLIPGIFQTRGYTEYILNVMREDLSDLDREVRIEVRHRRYDQVFRRPDPPQYFLILDESVLHRELDGPRVMVDQLRKLLIHAHDPHIVVRVVPSRDSALLALHGQFTVFDLGDEENAVLYRESAYQDDLVHGSDVIRQHRAAFEQMWERALSESATNRLIEARVAKMLSELDRAGPT